MNHRPPSYIIKIIPDASDWNLMLIFALFYDTVYIENTSTLFLTKQQSLSIITSNRNILPIRIIAIDKPI